MPIPTLVNKPSKDFTPCPEGSYQGKIIRVYYVGTQINASNPTYKPQGKLILVFEVDEPVPGSDGNYKLSKTVSMSLNEKSGLYKLFKPVLGSAYPNENEPFNPEQLLSMRVMVNVTHTIKGDRTYVDISSLGRIPRGMVPFEPESDEFCWSYDDPKVEGIPQWVYDLAAKCLEVTGETPPKIANEMTKDEQKQYKQSNSLAHQQAKMAAAGFKPQPINDNDWPEGTPF
jgi:hypothetical protein